MKTSSVSHCKIIDLDKITNRTGNLTIVQNNYLIPFSIQRIYYLYDIPNNAERGGHGHKDLFQLV